MTDISQSQVSPGHEGSFNCADTLIPGLNDSNEELESLCSLLQAMRASVKVNLLPYHKFGMGSIQCWTAIYP